MLTTIQATINPDVSWIFRVIASPLDYTFFFCPYTKTGEELIPFVSGAETLAGTKGKLTTILPNNLTINPKLQDNDNCRLYIGESHHFLTNNKFHFGFCLPPFHYQQDEQGRITAKPVLVNDILSAFRCSRSTHTEDRVGPLHLICLESMHSAVLPSGIFGAVMPKGWQGRHMRYINWLQTELAVIARIELPEHAVYYNLDADKSSTVHLKHELVIFGKAISGNAESRVSQLFPFARFRYQPFTYKLNGFDDADIWDVSQAFNGHDWYQYYILHQRKAFAENSGHYALRLSPNLPPVSLDDPRGTVLFVPDKLQAAAKRKIQVLASTEDIRSLSNAVHIKVGSRIKFCTYSPLAEGMLLELKIANGLNKDEDRSYKWLLDEELNVKMFHLEREWIAETLINAGLVPCLLKSDADRLACREKWAERQLTPIERSVRIEKGKVTGKESTAVEAENENWAIQFEEIGLRAAYPEVIAQWRQRMTKMKMHKISFAFQAEDVLALVCKNGVMNCNVMGLGKTIEILLTFLLRTNKKCLIVVPSKLLGEWQNEIESRLASYCAATRINWRGENIRHACDYQIIQWAEDCLERNIKPINLISYEYLVRPPRDTRYFHCKKCGTSAASMKFAEEMPCPKCNAERRKKWQQKCKEQGLQKFWIKQELTQDLTSEQSKASRFAFGRVKKFSKFYTELYNRGYVCIDQRPALPALIMMRRSKHVLIKKQMMQVGMEEKHRPVNGKLEKIAVPVMAARKRKRHLKWTFASLLRHRFNFIGLDEAEYIKNDKSQRSTAVLHLAAKTKIAATGTPVRGFPKSIINLLNWTISRTVFPEYRIKSDKGALRRFYDKYKTEVTNKLTGRKKILPKILNAEQFQTEIAPFMLRHTRNEPAVLACITKKDVPPVRREILDMDERHRQYYQLWLEKFAEWWQKEKLEEEGKEVPRGDILVKLGYLIGASSQPHFLLENILKGKNEEDKEWARMIGKYKGPLTTKQRTCFQMVKDIRNLGDKALVFSIRRNNLKLGMRWCAAQKPPIEALQIDGRVSKSINPLTGRSARQQLLDKFKELDYTALWAGLVCMKDGANLPEANHGIFLDLSWEPSDYRQASARMIRPAQDKTIYLTHLIHRGTIDEFVSLWTILKARSVDEGVDFVEFDDFSTEMIPDVGQYAEAIVDGTETRMKAKMELAIDHIRKQKEKGLTDDSI